LSCTSRPVPRGKALGHELPALLTYVLSFVYLGIDWNNHQHMLAAASRVTGGVLWANLHLLFWLSLIPFSTPWMSEHRFPPTPTGLLRNRSARRFDRVPDPADDAPPRRGRSLPAAHRRRFRRQGQDLRPSVLLRIALAFANRWIGLAVYVGVALIWLVPDRRVERNLTTAPAGSSE
jgi:uncharacterized membrane protein